MSFLFNKNNHFNLANTVTFFNIISGVMAIYFLTHDQFFGAALFAWLAGGFDILDGKIARKYNLSTDFGVQLDSYADFLSFVIVPTMFIYFAVIDGKELVLYTPLVAFAFIYYIISGLRRLIQFNLNADVGEVQKFFTGVPTPLGAILLWSMYLFWLTGFISEEAVLIAMIVIGYLLNSKIKIPHL
ncbi:phosphatidylserine synthase [Malaciobacter molluscorum LMG 25693]|uniref:Phosphatidylserine synthase n=1 Tax=Malaciobacter molluscorum LMG 25693 TaxID=870501 RepID=A0A2G1DGM8_9BACT|nr:CDP-alcohol phosphatidyltransferase family protein [Malaciobacter molluscorum]AXX92470.1 phosphatidylserine synthase [Malaciobacter molluscorum LMG 25693]PHO17659.1 phosphatidylserine synthase [Malaciobacter molluscorum LMG 25693]RXJ93443.1 phosphatidylserine synthase [Malaciobacter molluscorum]